MAGKITSIIFLICTVLMFNSCDLTELDEKYIFVKAPVKKINSIKRSEGRITFNVSASYPNGCGSYSHSEYETDGNQLDIAVYGKQKNGATCTQAIITIKGNVILSEPTNGVYTYSFWTNDSTSIDTTIVFD